MKNFIDKFFLRSNNLDYISKNIKDLSKSATISKIFEAIKNYSADSEIRYVGGCIRKIINKEKVDDIDFATNLEPKLLCDALKKNNINFYESGIEHGTITAIIDESKFEITSLREDISTDGRHAKVKFSKDWKMDASRRDFTINSIYSDEDGNIFDPYEGKKDLENGSINFIGNPDKRIKEDYLRILRYLRFYTIYSKKKHQSEILKILKINLEGIRKISKERLLDELRKLSKPGTLEKLTQDEQSLSLVLSIFPELKNIRLFKKLNFDKRNMIKNLDFIFLISLMVIDENDNMDYFLYKYNLSKNDKKRIKNLDDFYKKEINSKTFTENNMNKIFYYKGKQAVLDILNYRVIRSKKSDYSLNELIDYYQNSKIPMIPVNADFLMKKYEIPEGKQLGEKLRAIEEQWVKNNFKISDQQINSIIKN
ncbi:CCA tRNA nucleotidyltransferase [Candidatus Pelagibacter sp.]|nr:CCA tRNA nucleotidyltransferase [Candidatus Pelagibacter sp.]